GEQGLAGVDIADPGHDALVHDQVLDCHAAAASAPKQIFGVEVGTQRFGAQLAQLGDRVELRGRNQLQQPEAARIVVNQRGAVVELEMKMVVSGVEFIV